ncbi:metallophosphoesterase family protein, partial [Chloroflexota bacterium]
SDTHTRNLKGLSPELSKQLAKVDWVVHCGDYTSLAVVKELQALSKRLIGVHGNIDPKEIRYELPAKAVVDVEEKKIGIIHPSWGGLPFGIEEDIAPEFEGVDIILFGHTHDICHKTIANVIFLNPGQAYPEFGKPASLGITTTGYERIKVEIKTFE